jgi:hypothetical protein
MKFHHHLRTLPFLLVLGAPLVSALEGCGGGEGGVQTTDPGVPPGSTYDAEVAKQKAATTKAAETK